MSTPPADGATTASATPTATAATPAPLPDAPYRGIESFRFIDQQIFAARADEIWTLISNGMLYRAILLYGESGTGKSSLINAGLLPRAVVEHYGPDRLRVQPYAGREIKVERIRQGGTDEQPTYLPSNFTGIVPDADDDESIELSLADFRARLEQFRRNPDNTPPAASDRAANATSRPLLIFDQFEEFITLFEEAQRGGPTVDARRMRQQAADVQQAILDTLVELIQDEELPIKLLFSFREDYLAKLSLLFDHCPEVLDQAQRLLPPRVETLPEIIRAPFADPQLRAHFLHHDGQAVSELSADLARRIAADLGADSGGAVNLTELQIVCLRLWQSPDPEALFAADGIQGLLKGYGADVFRHFAPTQRDAAVALLAHMMTASNTRNIVSEEDLLSRAGADGRFAPAQLSAALNALGRSQIVRRELRRQIYFYEITSEYLVPWIKEQVAERRDAEARQQAEAARLKVEQERAQAVANFEAEQRRARRFKRLTVACILLAVAAVGLGGYSFVLKREAEQAQRTADEARKNTDAILEVLKAVASPRDADKQHALEQVGDLINRGLFPPQLAPLLLSVAPTTDNQDVAQAASQVLAQAAQADANVRQTISDLAAKLPAHFYIQIADESQREAALKVQERLKKEGYIVPGIEHVAGGAAPARNQLRYFRKDEPNAPNPNFVAELLQSVTGSPWSVVYLTGYENSVNIQSGQFEVWFAAPATTTPADGEHGGRGALDVTLTDEAGNTLAGLSPVALIVSVGALRGPQISLRGTHFDLAAGDYELIMKVAGYEPARSKFTIKPRTETRLSLQLSKRPALSAPPGRTPGAYDKPQRQLQQPDGRL